MRFSLAYNEDGSILTTPLAHEDARSLPRTGGSSDLFDTTYRLRDTELNEAMEGPAGRNGGKAVHPGNTRQEAHDGQL
jgi:hypothetical protein